MEEMDDLASFRPRSQTWPCKPSTFESYDGDGTSLISPADVNNATINSSANLSSNDSAIGLSSELNNAINITSAPVSTSPSSASSANSTSNANAQLTSSAKRSNSRRNAWGSASYADLITQAINNSPDKRLTLSQIYEWMVQNVPYFKDKGDSNSSAGWKNSIRHNLSLHNRFMRIQNEGTGKSSWWVINPDAKPGKAARRRAASMETSKFEKKRGRVKKKIENLNKEPNSPSSSLSEGLDTFPESPSFPSSANHFTLSPSEFRPRASSNASSCGRLSPIMCEPDMHDSQVPPTSPWNTNDLTQLPVYVGDTDVYSDQLAEMTSANMKLGGSSNSISGGNSTSGGGSGGGGSNGGSNGGSANGSFLSINSKTSPINQLSPASSQLTLTPSTYGFGSSLSVNGGVTYVNGINGGGSGSGTLSRNGSDPFFQTSAGIDGSITLTSLNAPASGQRSPARSFLDSSSATFNLTSLSPSLSPAQSMDTINNLQSSTFTSPSQQVSSATGVANIKQEFGGFSSLKSDTLNGTGPSQSQVMGHILTLNNPLPNDLDFDSLQGGLECDVNSVIQHELTVEGNLDFNFDPAAAAASNNNNNTLAHGASTRSWVH